ncbi:hypothetical protein COLO4_19569 [Corchorus olitorius]|uniref:Uncharacterized protein n=1 Tax=Corchorus olitorius TaxID=93759 RepID=A0A1R3J4Z3_9ROSI|nr:hypothetical protein COLO4_19569 [Corchorus olitorius]
MGLLQVTLLFISYSTGLDCSVTLPWYCLYALSTALAVFFPLSLVSVTVIMEPWALLAVL